MATKYTLKSMPETSFRAGCRNHCGVSARAQPGKIVVDAGDAEIGFSAERLAQVMHLMREEPGGQRRPEHCFMAACSTA